MVVIVGDHAIEGGMILVMMVVLLVVVVWCNDGLWSHLDISAHGKIVICTDDGSSILPQAPARPLQTPPRLLLASDCLVCLYTMGAAMSSSSPPPPPPSKCPNLHAEPSASSTTKASLRDFLIRDIAPQGHRMLLPFLTTNDRLDLSGCSQGLIDYRYHLSHVMILSHPPWVPETDEALTRLLSEQMSGVHVKVFGRKEIMKVVLEVVESGAMGQQLKGLSVGLGSSDEVQLLCGAMAEGKCRGLEELEILLDVSSLRDNSHTYTAGDIISLLAQGACPHLRRLRLMGCDETMEAGKMLVKAMESDHFGQEDLGLSNCSLGSVGLTSVVEALEETGISHCIQRLRLKLRQLTRQDGEALGGAICARAFPNLEELSLTWTSPDEGVGGEGLVAIMEDLEGGGCMGLKHLNLSSSQIPVNAAMALARVLSSGHCHNLQTLSCADAFPDKQSLLAFLQSTNSLSFLALRHLDIGNASMDEECSILFGDMMKAGAFPSLEKLHMIDYQIHRSVWEALEVWSCPKLRELELRRAKLDCDSAAALVSALTSGALSKLQYIGLQLSL